MSLRLPLKIFLKENAPLPCLIYKKGGCNMTEKEFWMFLKGLWERYGRVSQISGIIDSPDPQVQAAAEYMGGHVLLPNGYDKIPDEQIIKMGELLFGSRGNLRTKEAIMIILAHIPSKTALAILNKYNTMPDKGLEIFAQIALDECEMWNE
jgi:hypothetical protein